MNHFEVDAALRTAILLVDTREQDTPRLRRRLADAGLPWERRKLSCGDYSICCRLPDGDMLDLSGSVAIERKMSLDELCACFCRERPRFTREFERAAQDGIKLYLLIEGGSWEKAYSGDYRSRMRPQSLTASMAAFMARYPCQLITCEPDTSGRLIRDILYRELKQRLEGMKDESDSRADEATFVHV